MQWYQQTRIFIVAPTFSQNLLFMEQLQESLKAIRKKIPHFIVHSIRIADPEHSLCNQIQRDDELKKTHILIIARDPIYLALLKQMPHLKVIAKFGVGLDNISDHATLKELEERNIVVLKQKATNARSVAELTVFLMIGCMRNIFLIHNQLKSKNQWNRQIGESLINKNIGIIGCGAIGKAVIHLLIHLGVKCWVNDLVNIQPWIQNLKTTYPNVDLKFCEDKEWIYANCDCITLHVSLNETSYRLIKKQQLEMMQPHTILINTSRGQVIDETDLLWALKKNIIRGAACDVFCEEPITPDSVPFQLLHLENFSATPHLGSRTKNAIHCMATTTIENICNWLLTTLLELDKNKYTQEK